jgi:hypothetical protein
VGRFRRLHTPVPHVHLYDTLAGPTAIWQCWPRPGFVRAACHPVGAENPVTGFDLLVRRRGVRVVT